MSSNYVRNSSLIVLENFHEKNLELSIPIFFRLLILSIIFISTILFPFYFYLFRKNWKTYKMEPLYPIIRDFNIIVIILETFVLFIFISYFTFPLIELETETTSYFIMNSTIIKIQLSAYIFSVTVVVLQNLLLFFISLRRLIICIFSKYEERLTFTPKSIIQLLKLFYFITFAVNFGLRALKLEVWAPALLNQENFSDFVNRMDSYSYDDYYLIAYYGSDILVIFAGVFYAIMIIKLGSFSKVINAFKSKLEQYLFHQTNILFFMKVLTTPIVIYSSRKINNSDMVYFIFFLIDITSTMFSIQLSYMICNGDEVKRWHAALLRKFNIFARLRAFTGILPSNVGSFAQETS